MKILVTGGSGYIGSAVVRQLLEGGGELRVLVRETDDLSNLGGLDVELVYGDITDFHSVMGALDGCDRVFHLAAIYAIWLPDPKLMSWPLGVGAMSRGPQGFVGFTITTGSPRRK